MSEKIEKRGYRMTERALEQRRAAAAKSTGPKTEDGKAASSRNAWKHGEYSALNRLHLENAAVFSAFGKPCKTTCPKYPCSLVDDGLTREGGDCLDKTVYVDAFTSLIEGVQRGDYDAANSMAAAQLAGAVEILQHMREAIAEHGILIEQDVYDKEGAVCGSKTILNPVIPNYTKLLFSLGISLPEMMATPKAREKLFDPKDDTDPIAQLFSGIAQAAKQAPKKVITYENGEGDGE